MKGKNMKKIISFLILTAMIFTLSAISIFADTGDAPVISESETDEEFIGNTESDEENAKSSSGIDELYAIISDHIGEIFAFLACAFSGILMLCYKKGILPLIKGGISALSGGVSALSEEAQKQSESSKGISDMLGERLGEADEILKKMSLSLSLMDEKLKTSEENKSENELIKCVLLEEVNMLYEVFMAATLPEYKG